MSVGCTDADWFDIMARTTGAKIVSWGTPPEPQPTGWDAIRTELESKRGDWANIGEFSAATARKIAKDRFPSEDGFETTLAAVDGAAGRTSVWVRAIESAPTADPELAAADAAAKDRIRTKRESAPAA